MSFLRILPQSDPANISLVHFFVVVQRAGGSFVGNVLITLLSVSSCGNKNFFFLGLQLNLAALSPFKSRKALRLGYHRLTVELMYKWGIILPFQTKSPILGQGLSLKLCEFRWGRRVCPDKREKVWCEGRGERS